MTESFLDHEARVALVNLARRTIHAVVRGGNIPTENEIQEICKQYTALDQSAGAFVTIYIGGALRGCLGEMEARDALANVTVRCARQAPVADYRFEPVRIDELERLTFKVSILTPMRPLASPDRIRIGEHGLLVRYKGRSGVFLPEVPVEQGWDVSAFLVNLWRKAGIDPSVPVAATKLWTFTSEILKSEDFSPEGG